MCGRYTQTQAPETIAEHFQLDHIPPVPKRYNIAPTQQVACIRQHTNTSTREPVMLQWGLIPSWVKHPAIGQRLINARAETAMEKAEFRSSFSTRRCLVVADGFYEWRWVGRAKQFYYIHLHDHRPFAFAGLWDRWTGSEGKNIESCTVLTTKPNKTLAPIHNRMPMLLHVQDYDVWLDPTTKTHTLTPLIRPYPAEEMVAVPVSLWVNNPRHDDSQCVEPVSDLPEV